MKKTHQFLSSIKRCTQKKIGSFFPPHGVVVAATAVVVVVIVGNLYDRYLLLNISYLLTNH